MQEVHRVRLLEALLQGLDEGVHVIDANGTTVYYNKRMADIEGMRPEDVIGKRVEDVFTFPDAAGSTLLQAVRLRKSRENVKQTYFNQSGKAITTINRTYPILVDGQVVGAVEIARDVTPVERLQNNLLAHSGVRYTFASIVGDSPVLRDVIDQAMRAARTDSSILIIGETGTGKELFAQSVHAASGRQHGPFVSQNCAAIPEALMEGLLFGTARGAFTGAVDRPGLLEQADGGTLLLDELNSLSPPLQAKLLRVLQERAVRRVGELKDRPIDVRVLATINEDPLHAIAAGRLREDLYYRLSVVALLVPPLRDRKEDIPQLVAMFRERLNRRFGLSVEQIEPTLLQAFLAYDWPGNVRELEHIIEGAMNLVQDERELGLQHVPLHLRRKLERAMQGAAHGAAAENIRDRVQARDHARAGDQLDADAADVQAAVVGSVDTNAEPSGAGCGTWRERVQEAQRQVLVDVLSRHQGNVSATARELGLSRQNLQYWLRELNVDPAAYRT
ncbi:arginine utilization regulatory protein [Alicyclobacillus sacchari]|uniref:Arginine utilization regulatory protein n=1 Tax=Alicyclobacillus sacchari TaxID=392010 RepID=A0A4R8LRB0_9BACL|nr:sigma 54-interacting transcriptional regulator [Alicyclobacillus sacchari]TDY50034.1 arginine utilization regulatory protein [Alicyclobacillus sacchari]GMA57634.1 arginine utilization regulatory protein RocR [Alicyclobacillus sacchari]